MQLEQQVRFCTTHDGLRIAYATIGSGPPLVKAPNWLSHLQFELESPVWSHWIREFSGYHTLVRFDERGCGLSDWEAKDFSFEAWVNDLETVVDTIGLDRFILMGISQGGPISIAYAVRHPERVSHLILYGAYARGWAKRNLPPEELEAKEAEIKLARLGWGRDNPAYRQIFTSQFIPGATIEQMRWFNDLQRVSTSPENGMRFMIEFGNIDVSDLLPRVNVPTLVLHARGDARVPFDEGRQIAALIPDARFVPLEGKNHLLLEDETAWQKFLYEVRRFVGIKEIGPMPARQAAISAPSATGMTTFEFKTAEEKGVFDSLVKAFTEDYMGRRLYLEQAGWRTLTWIAENAKIPISNLYGRHGGYGAVISRLLSRGLVEARVFTGQKGRGGEVVRLRISYDKEPIREYVNQKIRAKP